MECSDELMLNTDEAVGQSFPLDTLERNGNEVLDKQHNDNELVENKDRRRKTGDQPEEKLTVRCIGYRQFKTNAVAENIDKLERKVWEALYCDDIDKLREVIEKGRLLLEIFKRFLRFFKKFLRF
mgnify:CR=1 FL=1